jgi:hypothetical protein
MTKRIVREVSEVGDQVNCDCCNKDWTDSTVSGGFMFDSYAYCPECAVSHIARIRSYNEENHIKERCPTNLSFADWIRRMRWSTGNDKVIISTLE